MAREKKQQAQVSEAVAAVRAQFAAEREMREVWVSLYDVPTDTGNHGMIADRRTEPADAYPQSDRDTWDCRARYREDGQISVYDSVAGYCRAGLADYLTDAQRAEITRRGTAALAR